MTLAEAIAATWNTTPADPRVHATLDLCAHQTAVALIPPEKPAKLTRRQRRTVHWYDPATAQLACGTADRPGLGASAVPGSVTCQGCMHTGAWRAAASACRA